MAAQPKSNDSIVQDAVAPDAKGQPAADYVKDARDMDAGSGANSPALELQAELEARIGEREYSLSPREVTASVIVFCFATWWALYMLATTFI